VLLTQTSPVISAAGIGSTEASNVSAEFLEHFMLLQVS
jgi:hypothetical protein